MKILSCENIREAERRAEENGTSLNILMHRAGMAAAEKIADTVDVAGKRVTVVCGKGNNGGDGIVLAKRLSYCGAFVTVCLPFGIPKSHPAYDYVGFLDSLKTVETLPDRCDILVDALLGIGLDRPVAGPYADVIEAMNVCNAVKFALDLPSGVFCDGGEPSVAFKADYTLTFIAPKPCFYLPQTAPFCGELCVIDIGVDFEKFSYETIERPDVARRNQFTHKGDYGTALVVAGSYGMCGAEILACRAALRSGVGIVRAVVCDKNYSAFCSALPEAVTIPVKTSPFGTMSLEDKTLNCALSGADAILVGCGLTGGNESLGLLSRILSRAEVPIVIDADGINALCLDISILRNTKAPIVITPHSGELARLFNTTPSEIERHRVSYARDFAVPHKCTVVLKGHNTIVATPDGRVFFNTTGNAGMATGGSGDVLAGMLVSMLAGGKGVLEASLSAVYYHGLAADNALKCCCETALMPSDIIDELKTVFAE